VIVVVPVVEIPDLARIVKWAALPRNTGACKNAAGVEYREMRALLGVCLTVSTPDGLDPAMGRALPRTERLAMAPTTESSLVVFTIVDPLVSGAQAQRGTAALAKPSISVRTGPLVARALASQNRVRAGGGNRGFHGQRRTDVGTSACAGGSDSQGSDVYFAVARVRAWPSTRGTPRTFPSRFGRSLQSLADRLVPPVEPCGSLHSTTSATLAIPRLRTIETT
jgi:hypothetical protein